MHRHGLDQMQTCVRSMAVQLCIFISYTIKTSSTKIHTTMAIDLNLQHHFPKVFCILADLDVLDVLAVLAL